MRMRTRLITDEDSEIISAQPASVEFMRDGDARDAVLMDELVADVTCGRDRRITLASRGMRFSECIALIDGR